LLPPATSPLITNYQTNTTSTDNTTTDTMSKTPYQVLHASCCFQCQLCVNQSISHMCHRCTTGAAAAAVDLFIHIGDEAHLAAQV
jgi:pyruvate-formate lyase-activating enzyme